MKAKYFFKFEDKLKNWIENNRVKWCCILFVTGLSLGFLGNFLLGGSSRVGTTMGLSYAFLLVIIEISAGGSGID